MTKDKERHPEFISGSHTKKEIGAKTSSVGQKMYGLTEKDIKTIIEAVKKLQGIEEVILFGSRAMGNYKKASDVDLCVIGSSLDSRAITYLKDILEEETLLPYFFDVIDFSQIRNEDLIQHIRQEGITLWSAGREG